MHLNHKILLTVTIKHLLVLLFLSSLCLLTYAQEGYELQQIHIRFNRQEMTVKEILDQLNSLPDISIVYNGTEAFLETKIVLPKLNLTAQEALDEIMNQAPVEILNNKNVRYR